MAVIPHFANSFTCIGHCSRLHFWTTVNNPAVNMDNQVSPWDFAFNLPSGKARSHSNSTFNFSGHSHVFHKSCTILYGYQCITVLERFQDLSSAFLITVILMAVGSVCISLTINGAEILYQVIGHLCIAHGKCQHKSFVYLFTGLTRCIIIKLLTKNLLNISYLRNESVTLSL